MELEVLEPEVIDMTLEDTSLSPASQKKKEAVVPVPAALGGVLLLGAIGLAAWLLSGEDQPADPPKSFVEECCTSRIIEDNHYYHEVSGEAQWVVQTDRRDTSEKYSVLEILHSQKTDGPVTHTNTSIKIEVDIDVDVVDVNLYFWNEYDEWELLGGGDATDDDLIDDIIEAFIRDHVIIPKKSVQWLEDKIWIETKKVIARIKALPKNKEKLQKTCVVQLLSRYPDPDGDGSTIFELDHVLWDIMPFVARRTSMTHWEFNGESFAEGDLIAHLTTEYDEATAISILNLLKSELPHPLIITPRLDRTHKAEVDVSGFNQMGWEINNNLVYVRWKWHSTDEHDGSIFAELETFGKPTRRLIADHEFDNWLRERIVEDFGHIPYLENYLDEIVQHIEDEIHKVLVPYQN